MKTVALFSLMMASVLTSACVTHSQEKPFLTSRAFDHAAVVCHVVSEGVHHAKGSDIPYADYLIPAADGQARSDEGRSRECLAKALHAYRYDFLGEKIPKTVP